MNAKTVVVAADKEIPYRIRWSEAIKAFEQATEDAKKPFRAEFEDVVGFIMGHDFVLALRLLKASGEAILIGCEDDKCVSPNYFLGQEGFFTKTASGTEEEKVETKNIFLFNSKLTKEGSSGKIAAAFRNLNKDKNISFHDFIYGELNRVAEDAFKQKK